MNNSELKHFGIIGMKWGIRRRQSAINVQKKDAADLRKHGMNKEASGIEGNIRRMKRQNKEAELKIALKQTKSRNPKKPIKELSNKEINSILKSPIMQKKLRIYEEEKYVRAARTVIRALFYAKLANKYIVPYVKKGINNSRGGSKWGKGINPNDVIIDSYWVHRTATGLFGG